MMGLKVSETINSGNCSWEFTIGFKDILCHNGHAFLKLGVVEFCTAPYP